MRKFLLAFFALAGLVSAANIKLYLKDGSYQVVREYEVKTDRVRFYTVERGEWEEIPLELVDMKRTESEAAERKAELEKDAKALSEEEKIQRDIQKEIRSIPQDPGVYWIDETTHKTNVIKNAQSTVHTNKGRSVLAKLAPIPIVAGKGTVELQGMQSANVFTNREQEFYIQLSQTERFGIVKLTPKGGVRIVENLTYVPVTKEVVEEPILIESFQKQLTEDGLYKIWAKEPLEPGEYAIMEYTEGKLNLQVWDFAIAAGKR